MLVEERYSELIFRKIRDLTGGSNCVMSYYRKGYHYIACIGINLIIVTRSDYLATSLIYADDHKEIVHRPIINHFKLNLNQYLDNRTIYSVLFSELKKQEVKVEFLGDLNHGVNLYLEEVFGPIYVNLDGYLVCRFNNDYTYNNLKSLGTIIGHILTNQSFSYKAYLNNLFIEEDN